MTQIAILHFAAPPTVGGVEQTMMRHARLMLDAGYAVRIIAASGARFDERIEVVIVSEFGSRHAEVLRVKKQLDAGSVTTQFKALRKQIKMQLGKVLSDVDIMIAHNVFTLHKNLALTSALHQHIAHSNLRTIAWHHDFAWTNPLYRDQLHDGEPWDLLRQPWPKVQHVTVSQARRSELAQLYDVDESQIEVVPPGVDSADFFGWQPLTSVLVERLNLLAADVILLLPARITRRKNIELGVRMLAELRQQTALDARLIVTGPPGPHNPANDEYLQSLLRLRQEHGLDDAVHFLYELGSIQADGDTLHVSEAVMGDLFTLADAMFFPSLQEGFGIPVLEAGLARLPAFCADITPLRETGAHLATYFDPKGNPADIAALIVSTLQSDRPGLLRRRVRQNYSWTGIFNDRIQPLLEMR